MKGIEAHFCKVYEFLINKIKISSLFSSSNKSNGNVQFKQEGRPPKTI